ncbi:H/ACA ribonucleoprotein complex subunit 2-like protein [Bacillus rossius redtenbacheri]|uniref:H/ACA ribonucleoprotein complex subunit 2-like protein n=1 Tax=Bacillus rossius redtenbacheri TaxID=93214 RepID=UPI002FDCBF24
MGKDKELDPSTEIKVEDVVVKEEEMLSYEEKLKFVSPIAKPMAPRKLTKKIYKLIKKASKDKKCLKSGLKAVQKELRRGTIGIMVIAGDVLPVDIVCHLPVMCEDRGLPYCYTPSGSDLGLAMGTKRRNLAMLVPPRPEYQELYDEVKEGIQALPPPA